MKNIKKSFNDLLLERPWDKKNMERHGKANGAMTIFHYTWLDLLAQSPIALEAYRNSKYQKGLEEFIENNLSEFIYLGKNFDAERIKKLKEVIWS